LLPEAQERTGHEWVRDSLWFAILRRAGNNVRMLKTTPIARPGFELSALRQAIIDNTRDEAPVLDRRDPAERTGERRTGFDGLPVEPRT